MRGAAVQHGGVSDECAGGAKQEWERGIRVGLWMREGRSRGWGVGGGRRRRKSSRGEEGSITWPLGEGDPRTSITPPTHKICLLPVMPTISSPNFTLQSDSDSISPHGQMKITMVDGQGKMMQDRASSLWISTCNRMIRSSYEEMMRCHAQINPLSHSWNNSRREVRMLRGIGGVLTEWAPVTSVYVMRWDYTLHHRLSSVTMSRLPQKTATPAPSPCRFRCPLRKFEWRSNESSAHGASLKSGYDQMSRHNLISGSPRWFLNF